jgi:hypothetical protein
MTNDMRTTYHYKHGTRNMFNFTWILFIRIIQEVHFITRGNDFNSILILKKNIITFKIMTMDPL